MNNAYWGAVVDRLFSVFENVQSVPDKRDQCTTRVIHVEVFHSHIAVTSVTAFKHKKYGRILPWKQYSAQATIGNGKHSSFKHPG